MKRRLYRIAIAAAVAAAAAAGGWRLFAHAEPAETAPAAEAEVPVRVAGPGTVQARVPVTVGSRVTAHVVALHADQGDLVRRGQLLAELDDRDLAAKSAGARAARETVGRNIAAAEAALAKARAERDLAQAKQRRDAELLADGFISQASYDASRLGLAAAQAALDSAAATLAARKSEAAGVAEEARFAQAQWSHTRLAAPLDALVISRHAEVGSLVTPGAPVFRLVDPKSVWIAARIDESLVGRLAEGMPARIRLRSGTEHDGRVARISRQSDAATRELEVNVAFVEPPARFAIDQEAEVTIRAGVEKGLAVPAPALLRVAGRQGVLVARDGRAEFRAVTTGASDGKRVIVASGLEPGEPVLVAPRGVKPGARIAAWTSR